MIRQEDIAKKLNISRTTVARALNGTGSINPETREKILKTCEELGYKRNPISSSLALKKKKNIYAFVVKAKNNYYANDIKLGFKKAQGEFKFYKYHLNIIETDIDSPLKQLEELKGVIAKGDIDGVIITPLLKDEIKLLKNKNPQIFFIALDLPLDNSTFNIYSNYYRSGRITAELLQNILNPGEEILLIDTEDDRISSKPYYNGFYEKIVGDNICKISEIVYQSDLKNNIDKVIKNNLTDNIKSIYSSRFLVEIVEYVIKNTDRRLKIVANGLSDNTRKLIESNDIIATVREKYKELGYISAKVMFEHIYKGIKPKCINIELESEIILKENLY